MMNYRLTVFVISIIIGLVSSVIPQRTIDLQARKLQDELADKIMHDDIGGKGMHPVLFDHDHTNKNRVKNTVDDSRQHETENSFWYDHADKDLNEKIDRPLNKRIAKNVIFFLGDGMSIPTLMAARTYLGQLEGRSGEEGSLFWESFPYTGLVKTWCLDKQVADSACTSTAYLGGVKTKYGILGLNGNAKRGKCENQIEANHVNSIAKWAQDKGKGTGIVTTTRVTHASPGGAYAHVAERGWESDTNVLEAGYDPKKCQDIASQLVNNDPGKNFKVIMGGGRREFLPKTMTDEKGDKGARSDGVNLIDEWKRDKSTRNSKHAYVWNRTSLNDVAKNPDNYDYVLGLFDATHCPYHLEGSPEIDPSLAEMTEAAVRVLQKEENGYFLFVEGGRIDHAHHNTYATLALDETVELAKAVKIARDITSESDTLIIVSADHAHTMSVSGYAERGHKINNVPGKTASDGIPYATLNYANGPGYRPEEDGNRYNPANADYDNPRYMSPAVAPLDSETHGGDDVAIFASGPWAHLFTGTIEQSNIPHFLGYASCVGKSKTSACAQLRHPYWKDPKLM